MQIKIAKTYFASLVSQGKIRTNFLKTKKVNPTAGTQHALRSPSALLAAS